MSDKKKVYAVWVGGVADYFDDKFSAQVRADSWRAEGYDDVQVEVIEGNAMVDYLINPNFKEEGE